MTFLLKGCGLAIMKIRSVVKCYLFILVLFSMLDSLKTDADNLDSVRDSRKLFGGYRITPAYCKASRASRFNRGNTICMFNHECAQRGGEVVGACMDGFLFGACCQLKSDSQSHIPKGPGVVMTGYLEYPEGYQEEDFDEGDDLNAWHNSFKPVITPGYRPTDKTHSKEPVEKTTEQYSSSLSSEIISEGVSQITNTLLNSPPKDSNIIYMRPGQNDGIYSYSTITHGMADTILVGDNGFESDNVARPSDFTVHIPSLQNNFISTTTTSNILSTYRPVKPVFRPKPTTKPDKITYTTKLETVIPPKKPISSTEKYTSSTATKETQKVTELTSLQSPITSIIQMLNESTPQLPNIETSTSSAIRDVVETKSSPRPSTTDLYSNTFLPQYSSTGHYVTLKPSQSVTILSNTPSHSTTSNPIIFNRFSTPPSKRPQDKLTTSIYSSSTQFSSPRPSQSTSQAIDSFNRYPTNPDKFDDSITTFTYVTSSTTPKPTITRKPPSTSYIYGTQPSVRPATSSSSIIPNYEIAPDTFARVTPTVIVLNGFQTTKPASSTEDKEPQFVEIPQEPLKKPINHITVNNHIESTNNIYMGKPPSYDRPSSPTIVITPKPSLTTTPLPLKYSTKPSSVSSISTIILGPTSSIYDIVTDVYSPTTFKPEMQTSPDDLINFPPVRNPMLNTTGANSGMFNTSISISDSELDLLQDVEFTTPSFLQEDENLNEKMNLFVNKIVGSLQGTFQELHDIVILNKKPNATKPNVNTAKPTRRPVTTPRPIVPTRKPPVRTTTTRKPPKTTKRPPKPSTPSRKPTTSTTAYVPTTKKPTTTTRKTKPPQRVTTTTPTTAPTVTATDYQEITTELYSDPVIDYNDKHLCGVRPLVKSGRIVGGKNAKFGEWPWQVLIRESTWLGLFTKNKCGGVLITNRFVTTAAHCQPGFIASLVAVFGENDISGEHEPKRPVSKNVRRVIVHRQYDAATFENDLALLELESPVKFDAHIVPICMPPDGADFTGRLATVTGWGRLKYGGGVPAVLQEVQVPVIENHHCQEMFQTAGHSKNILNSFLCAGYTHGQKDSCEGDSGGPLVLQREDGRWQLVGTVSHGIKCAAPYLPGVYMRTTYYKPWLKSITGVH